MLVKWIVCTTTAEMRERFARGQALWGGLSSLEGFFVQAGGWLREDPLTAGIVSLWRDEEAYRRFMAEAHDVLWAQTAQQGTYRSISVTLADVVMTHPGGFPEVADALSRASFLCVTDGPLGDERDTSLPCQQRDLWRRASDRGGGMLGSLLARVRGGDRCLNLTLWRDEASHDRYAERLRFDSHECVPSEKGTHPPVRVRVPLFSGWTVRGPIGG